MNGSSLEVSLVVGEAAVVVTALLLVVAGALVLELVGVSADLVVVG